MQAPDSAEMADNQVMGTTAEPDYESSPDVQVDGSVAESETEHGSVSEATGASSPLHSAYYHVRGVVLAPFGLLREYLIPILAFLIVGLGILYGFSVLL